jgi:hypothetical protein
MTLRSTAAGTAGDAKGFLLSPGKLADSVRGLERTTGIYFSRSFFFTSVS